jgi:hypothetical protein
VHQVTGAGNGFDGIVFGQVEQVAAFQSVFNVVNGIAGFSFDDIGQFVAVYLAFPDAPIRAALPENVISYMRHQIVNIHETPLTSNLYLI